MISVHDKRYPIQGLRSYRKPHIRQRVAPCRGSSPQERVARLGALRFQHVVASQHLGSNACWNVFAEPVTNPCPFLWPSDRLFEGKRRIIRFQDGTPSQLGSSIQFFGLHAFGNLLYMPVHRIEFVTDLSDHTVDHPFSLPVKQNTGVLDCPGKPMVEGHRDGNESHASTAKNQHDGYGHSNSVVGRSFSWRQGPTGPTPELTP